MKSFTAIVLLGAGLSMAQDIGSLPACGQTCINNMVQVANSAFGCAVGDVACYCTNANFGYGVRDCSNQACASQEDANRVISFGVAYCQNIAPPASSAAASTGAIAILTSALASASASATGSVTGTAASGTTGTGALASATGSAASRASSASSALASGASSAASAASSALSSGASAASSALSSGASAASSAAASASGLVSSILGGASSAAASATQATQTPGAAPKMTGLPVAGFVGLAAWLLI